MQVYKAYKYRIYPNKEQEEAIQKTFGCCRSVYNQCLAHKKEAYDNDKTSLSKFDLSKWVNHELALEQPWLKEVDSIAIGYAIQNICC